MYQNRWLSEISYTTQAVYLSSMSLFIVGSAVVATSRTIGLIIGMRALQAVGWVHVLVSILRCC